MPTVLNKNGFRFFFYSNDHEPIHIHVEKEKNTAKFDLVDTVTLVKSNGFNTNDLKKMRQIIEQNKELFKTKWYEYFTN